jgi:hypothetical protein
MFINSLKATTLSWFISTAQLLMNEHDCVVSLRELMNIQMVLHFIYVFRWSS